MSYAGCLTTLPLLLLRTELAPRLESIGPTAIVPKGIERLVLTALRTVLLLLGNHSLVPLGWVSHSLRNWLIASVRVDLDLVDRYQVGSVDIGEELCFGQDGV